MSLADELQAIYIEHGKLTPSLVLDVATDKKHALHGRFEWDNKVAGHQFRLGQAHELIRSVKTSYIRGDDTTAKVRAFHAVRSSDGGHEYRKAEDIVFDDVARTVLLNDMRRDFEQLRSRYAQFIEFADMIVAAARDLSA